MSLTNIKAPSLAIFKKDKEQIIMIDANAITVVCTMSKETYDLKLQRGELYV